MSGLLAAAGAVVMIMPHPERERARPGLMATYGIMCQRGKGYSLWLANSHEQEHPRCHSVLRRLRVYLWPLPW